MGISAAIVTIMNFISFRLNYFKNVNALKLRSVRSQGRGRRGVLALSGYFSVHQVYVILYQILQLYQLV